MYNIYITFGKQNTTIELRQDSDRFEYIASKLLAKIECCNTDTEFIVHSLVGYDKIYSRYNTKDCYEVIE